MDKSNGCSFSSISSIAVFSSAVFVVSLILVRLLYVLYCSSKPLSKRASKPFSTLIILGSGGHTAEMLNLLAVLQKGRFNPRFYIAAATDNMSLQKAQLLENSLAAENATRVTDTAQFMKIYRSREVGQSYITSVWTTFVAMVHALWLMIKIRPEVVPCISFFASIINFTMLQFEVILYCYCPDTLQWTWNLHSPLCYCIYI
ncbi:hypothetical protein AAZV13_01G015200 [Glycine max]